MTIALDRIAQSLHNYSKVLVAYGVTFGGLAVALFWKLGSLLPGYSNGEIAAYNASLKLHDIWQQPFDAPYHLLVFGLHQILPANHSYLAVRLASALIGWATLLVFCALLHHWYGTRTAILGTLIFGSSAWFLHVARLGSPKAALFGLLILIACGVWFKERRAPLGVVAGLVLSALLLYTPGMIWIIALGVIWQWKAIDRAFTRSLGAVTLGGFAFLALLFPLAWHFYKNLHSVRDWLALPAHFNLGDMLHTFINVPLAVLIRGQSNPERWLGQLPLLSVFGVAMFVLGVYVYGKQAKPGRVRLIVLLGVIAAGIIALTDRAINMTVIVPFVYLLVANGVSYLLELWLGVFPRNPIARTIGVGLITIVVGLSCLYNIRNYFVAWPGATVTRAVFANKQP